MVNTGPVEPPTGSYPSAPWAVPPTPVTPGSPMLPPPPPPASGRGPATPPTSSSRQVGGALLFVVVLIGVAVAFAWYRGENPTPGTAGALPTPRPTAGASATGRPTATPTATTAPTAAPTEPATADAILLAAIADSVRRAADCVPIPPTPDFATASSTISCLFRSGTITGVAFRLYDDPAAAQAAYDGWQDVLEDVGDDCASGSFEGPWAASDGREGRLLCYVADDGVAYLFWTDSTVPVVGVAWRTDGFLKGLHGWWQERYPLAF